jgi:hypothetical protein
MTNSTLVVRESAGGAVVHTVLGEAQTAIRTGGKIRAGIKVLTQAAARNARVKEIYDNGVAAGLSFDQIEERIKQALPDMTKALVPKNVPYFSVRPGDFANPKVAEQLLEAHGEDRGDGRKLYRFPVVFPADQWQVVMPHTLRAWGATGLKYWAEYSNDGGLRHCMQYATPQSSGGRVIRLFGGRKAQPRPDNGGICNPESCNEYQTRKCNLQGRIIVYVPGVESVMPLEVPTQSFYGMSEVRSVLENVAFMRGGRISGLLDRNGRTFYMTKVLKPVTHLNDEGKPQRVDHWIITLEAPIDVASLLRLRDDETLKLAAADEAVDLMTVGAMGQVVSVDGVDAATAQTRHGVHDAAQDSGPGNAEGEDGDPVPPGPSATVVPAWAADPAQPRKKEGGPPRDATGGVTGVTGVTGATGGGLQQLQAMLAEMRIEFSQFDAYASKKWGRGWSKNLQGISKALGIVDGHHDEPDSLRLKITQETQAFS